MIEQLADFPSNVVAFACKGRVSKKDYETVLEPAVKAAFEKHDKLRLYYRAGPGFDGVEAGAAWEDFKVGMAHLTGWERIAVVTDVDWIVHAVRAFGFLMPAAVKTFSLAEADQARAWIAEA